jgi:hypothetical protein
MCGLSLVPGTFRSPQKTSPGVAILTGNRGARPRGSYQDVLTGHETE